MSNLFNAAKKLTEAIEGNTQLDTSESGSTDLMIVAQHIADELEELKRAIAEQEEIDNRIQWTRVNNDINGNPRYVCHFLNFIGSNEDNTMITGRYEVALRRARKLGGKKFHNKQYGGGIVFSSYSLPQLEKQIKELIAAY
jgi:hypothetical protein